MELSKKNQALLLAFNKGYTVTKEGELKNPKGKLLSPHITVGYKNFNIRLNGVTVNVKIHRLQAYQKYGDLIFKKDIVARHKNNDSLDNSWDNILIGTHSMNMMDKPEEDRIKYAKNASLCGNPRTKEERYVIYEMLYNNIPFNKIVETTDISSKGTLSFMKNKSEEYQEFLKEKVASVGHAPTLF